MVDLMAHVIADTFERHGPMATVRGIPLVELAMAFDRFDLVQWLLERGAVLMLPDRHGRNALHFARQGEHVKRLVDAGAGASHCDRAGRQPIHAAARAGRADVMAALVDRGAAIDAPNGAGRTPLHLAAARGHCESVAWLLAHGANVHAVDRRGHPPLWLAAVGGHVQVVRHLVDAGANVHWQHAGRAWWRGAPLRLQADFAAWSGEALPWSPADDGSQRLLERLVAGNERRAWRPRNWAQYAGE